LYTVQNLFQISSSVLLHVSPVATEAAKPKSGVLQNPGAEVANQE